MLGKHDICDIYVVYKDKRAYPNYLIHFNWLSSLLLSTYFKLNIQIVQFPPLSPHQAMFLLKSGSLGEWKIYILYLMGGETSIPETPPFPSSSHTQLAEQHEVSQFEREDFFLL
jgi:hypothetical protein